MADELALARGEYDDVLVGDITVFDPRLENRFDLIVSWQVFEHVAEPARAYENIRRYLKDGGVFVARMTARYALFAIANRMVPFGFARRVMGRIGGRAPDTVFKAYYRDASLSDLRRIFDRWGSWQVWVEFGGQGYFDFSPPSRWAYALYTRWARRRPGLASHFTVIARNTSGSGTSGSH
jgi:SAM-dependent methyltransferase